MDMMQSRLFDRLRSLGMSPDVVPYPAHKTVEEGKMLRGVMVGTFTKNLLLKDKKGRLYLVVAHEDRVIDLRTLHRKIGASGRVGFASGDQMREILAVEPGALTPFAVMNDDAGKVGVVVDATLFDAHQLNFHPFVQTLSMGICPRDLVSFVRSCEREPITVRLDIDCTEQAMCTENLSSGVVVMKSAQDGK
ncbi:prolyl-tRNA synthetase associated domain-containing protein [Bradyrhizobium cenepequi]|uniref:prolyl-tRNA synthetase associated domain-containing protein n=1 Tax=Bradyrhizobium cenepequi TaxID=2821403 RepID=UPI001CE29722|nr:prolyl-tRNA synthetase associated domain-containing protein [Bradyrhizobium cenepequi]MCA6112694.1 prolyl-tRNA synthetase associated domain-containing protein [Bradyrhizobium cenepequi]